MNVQQYRELIVRPTLQHLRMWSPGAEELVLGTALHESDGLKFIQQLGGGPALGFTQVEPATHNDVYANYLVYNPHVRELVLQIEPSADHRALLWNLKYGVAMCRLVYRRAPEKLPEEGDLEGQARLWRLRYNSLLGKGTVEKYIESWNRHVR